MTRFTAPLPMDVRTYPEVLRLERVLRRRRGPQPITWTGPPGVRSNERLRQVRHAHVRQAAGLRQERPAGGAHGAVRRIPRPPPQGQAVLPAALLQRPAPSARPQRHRASRTTPPSSSCPPTIPTRKLVREDFARYYDEIARFDDDFGEVLAELDERGLADNTIVAFMGDNGCSQFRGKGTLYEFGIHVPLLRALAGRGQAGLLERRADLRRGPRADVPRGRRRQAPPKEMTGQSFAQAAPRRAVRRAQVRLRRARRARHAACPASSNDFDLGRCVARERTSSSTTRSGSSPTRRSISPATPSGRNCRR